MILWGIPVTRVSLMGGGRWDLKQTPVSLPLFLTVVTPMLRGGVAAAFENLWDPSSAIFLKSWCFKDIKYGIVRRYCGGLIGDMRVNQQNQQNQQNKQNYQNQLKSAESAKSRKVIDATYISDVVFIWQRLQHLLHHGWPAEVLLGDDHLVYVQDGDVLEPVLTQWERLHSCVCLLVLILSVTIIAN